MRKKTKLALGALGLFLVALVAAATTQEPRIPIPDIVLPKAPNSEKGISLAPKSVVPENALPNIPGVEEKSTGALGTVVPEAVVPAAQNKETKGVVGIVEISEPIKAQPTPAPLPKIVTPAQAPTAVKSAQPEKVPFPPQPIPAPAPPPQSIVIDAPPGVILGDLEPARNDLGLSIGAGIYFLRPTWASNNAYTQTITSTTPAPPNVTSGRVVDFTYTYGAAPRIFANYTVDCGLNARLSWWRFDQSSSTGLVNPFSTERVVSIVGVGNNPGTTSTFSPVNNFGLNAGESDTLTFDNRLVMDIWDLDVSQRLLGNNCWNVSAGAGVRYAHIAQYYDALSFRTGVPVGGLNFPGRVNLREVHIKNQINGAGLDIFLEGKRSFGGLGLAFYGNARGGLLFGTGRYAQFAGSAILTTPAAAPFVLRVDHLVDRNIAGLPFLEAELGVEWQARGTGRVQPFLRGGVVGHNWFGIGSALSNAGNTNTLSNLGLFGATVTGGINF